MSAVAILLTRTVDRNRVDLLFAVVAPLFGLVGLTFVLQDVIATGAMTYAQYVLPAVVVQAMLFGALTTIDRAAWENASGMSRRLRTLPISQFAPLAARMLYCLFRGVLALLASMVAALVFGFRFSGGPANTVLFIALSLLLTVAFSLGADALGSVAARAEIASQLILVPQLLLVLLSTGMAPADSFPTWLQPFVINQPISRITDTLRELTTGRVDTADVTASICWCMGLLIAFGCVALRLQRRTR